MAIVNVNMIHISPWETCVGLMAAAGRLLIPNRGLLFMYGAYKVGGQFTTKSNEDFDQNLKLQNQDWGLRDVELVESEASKNGLVLLERIDMPANNFSLVFLKKKA